ncbi:MAG: DUF983 domain-containing protein [Acidimicrobiales bacterium]|nr:DUF983 domain-containing protein [Acidimicrobiales bacterium]
MKHAEWQPQPHQGRQPRHRRAGPGWRTMLWRGVRKRCPACGQNRLFHRWFTISERCPRCGLKFERIEGHWIGAIGMNTIITFGFLLIALAITMIIVVGTDVPRWRIAAGGVMLALIIPPLIDPFTRTLWTAIDVGMRPLEAHEVDWTIVAPGVLGNSSAPPDLPSRQNQSRNAPPEFERQDPPTREDS